MQNAPSVYHVQPGSIPGMDLHVSIAIQLRTRWTTLHALLPMTVCSQLPSATTRFHAQLGGRELEGDVLSVHLDKSLQWTARRVWIAAGLLIIQTVQDVDLASAQKVRVDNRIWRCGLYPTHKSVARFVCRAPYKTGCHKTKWSCGRRCKRISQWIFTPHCTLL
jgi:hypothetical protein